MAGPYNYSTKLYCKNCNKNVSVEIARGTTKEDFVKDNVCPECGCKTLSLDLLTEDQKDVLYPYKPFFDKEYEQPHWKDRITCHDKDSSGAEHRPENLHDSFSSCCNCKRHS